MRQKLLLNFCVIYGTPCHAIDHLAFSLTHVTCVALHHIVVIRSSTSVTYRTLSHPSGHQVVYREC